MDIKTTNHLPKKYEVSFIFPDTLCRIQALLLNAQNIEVLIKKTQLPYLFTSKPNPMSFTYTIGEYTSIEYNKKIKWLIDSEDSPTPIDICFMLVSNTLDDTTLLIFELQLLHPDKVDKSQYNKVVSGCQTVCKEVINEIDTLLQINSENIYEYKSSIINSPMRVIWDYITEELYKKLFPVDNVRFSGPKDQVGTVISWTFLKDNTQGECKIITYDRNPNKIKWKYSIVPQGGPAQNQEVIFTLIKVDEEQTFFSITHKFNEVICKETIKILESNKKYMINCIKMDLEKNHTTSAFVI